MTDTEAMETLFSEGTAFASEVNDILEEQFNGDITDPGWFEYCRQMDEWVAATAS